MSVKPGEGIHVRWAARVAGVKEISIRGTADAYVWSERLWPEGFAPVATNGMVEVRIGSTEARFKGILFREVTIAVAARSRDPEIDQDGFYLAQAFNSVRAFAFVERVLFSTPYDHGSIVVETGSAPRFELTSGNRVLLKAGIVPDAGGEAREPSRIGHDQWNGPIYLPARGTSRGRLFFLAEIGGKTSSWPFAPADQIEIDPDARFPVLGWLVESRFRGVEWSVRERAVHAKSKSYVQPHARTGPLGEPQG